MNKHAILPDYLIVTCDGSLTNRRTLTSFGNLTFNSFMINYKKVKITFYGLWIAWGRVR
jgi:hypothetical protein